MQTNAGISIYLVFSNPYLQLLQSLACLPPSVLVVYQGGMEMFAAKNEIVAIGAILPFIPSEWAGQSGHISNLALNSVGWQYVLGTAGQFFCWSCWSPSHICDQLLPLRAQVGRLGAHWSQMVLLTYLVGCWWEHLSSPQGLILYQASSDLFVGWQHFKNKKRAKSIMSVHFKSAVSSLWMSYFQSNSALRWYMQAQTRSKDEERE